MNSKLEAWGRTLSSNISKFYPGVSLEGMRQITEHPVRIIGTHSEIRTRYVPYASQMLNLYTNQLSMSY